MTISVNLAHSKFHEQKKVPAPKIAKLIVKIIIYYLEDTYH